jgi:CheY-like chemotaxis protein
MPIQSVLVIDDDDFTQVLFQGMLEDWGIADVHLAGNGREALRLMAALPRPPDVLICDVFMPDMDGIEFLEVLAQKKYAGSVVLVSGMNMDMMVVARDLALSNGLRVVGAFIKPVKADLLAHTLGLDTHFNPA